MPEETCTDAEREIANQLNELWRRVKNFLSDLNDKGQPIILNKPSDSARLKFTRACERYSMGSANLPFEEVKRAFNTALLQPALTDAEYRKLFSALEVYSNEDRQLITYGKIVSAMYDRQQISYKGFFPRLITKTSAITEKQAADEKKAEAEKEKQRIHDEEKKKADAKQKQIAALVRQQQILSKQKTSTTKDTKKTNNALQEQQEKKKKEKEEARQAEELKLERERDAKEEMERVKKDSIVFKKLLNHVKGKFLDSGDHQKMLATFRMYDSKTNGRLSFNDFKLAMIQAKVHCNFDEIQHVKQVIYNDDSQEILYKDLFDILYGVKTIDTIQLIAADRHRRGLDTGIDPEVQKLVKKISMDPTFQSNENLTAGSVSGFSSILRLSDDKNGPVNKLIDINEPFQNYTQIKQMFLDQCYNFEELLQIMNSNPKPGNEMKIQIKDFVRAVNHLCGTGTYSSFQLKTVFQQYAENQAQGDIEKAFIPLKNFKEIFYPGRTWKIDASKGQDSTIMLRKLKKAEQEKSDEDENLSEASMIIDDILQGRGAEQILAEKNLLERKEFYEEELERQKILSDNELETGSNMSQRIEDILNAKSGDPRVMKGKEINSVKNQNNGPFNTKKGNLTLSFADLDDTQNKKSGGNNKYKLLDNKSFDQAVDKIFGSFISSLIQDLKSNSYRNTPDYESYIEKYGKESKGFLTFTEFQELYENHVQNTEENLQKKHVSQNLLRALFSLINPSQSGKISRDDFCKLLKTKQAPTFRTRLSTKLKRSGGRLLYALKEECQSVNYISSEVDGEIPLPVFQAIMNEYDLPMINSDKEDLKQSFYLKIDALMNEIILYKQLFNQNQSAETLQISKMTQTVIKIQKHWRGILARRAFKKKLRENTNNQDKKLIDQVNGLTRKNQIQKDETQILDSKNDRVQQKNNKQANEESQKKKLSPARQRLANKEDLKAKQKNLVGQDITFDRTKKEIISYILQNYIEPMINKAYSYGESLQVCREIQQKYENRPVIKFVYPLLKQFQFTTQGVSAKSLQSFSALGQVMFLNSQSQLYQYDIISEKNLAPVPLGTRPPLKFYNIIDIVVDQQSWRIYTLNSNWILEMWNIVQNSSTPLKRIAVCQNEGGKDFISLYYENTFNDSKPRFLCLQESNQQLLVVNTTCIDGSIVFIDPISFSILKKVKFNYPDYELPIKIRESIKILGKVLDKIKKQKGKDIQRIFNDILEHEKERQLNNKQLDSQKLKEIEDNQEVGIKELVDSLCELDLNLVRQDVINTINQFDEDGSQKISLNEFLNYFGQVEQNDEKLWKAKEENLLQDEIWPRWVLDEGKMAEAQTILSQMYHFLEKSHGINAEQVFSIYDKTDSGLITQQEFQRVIKNFFGDVVTEGEKLQFVMKLTAANVDTKIRYREFCQLLNKRFVKNFKLVRQQQDNQSQDIIKQKSALEFELERPPTKESSLNYVLRKSVELQIDLRRELMANDPSELNIISRVNFQGILINLPLGLNEEELEEIFDNDLHYDNNGNVDYIKILNSEIFMLLEKKLMVVKALNVQKKKEQKEIELSKIEEMKNQHDLSKSTKPLQQKSTKLQIDGKNPDLNQEIKHTNKHHQKHHLTENDIKKLNDKHNQREDQHTNQKDNRKVVIEDLVFIDDLEIIIYTTVRPRTSTIFITSLCKPAGKDQSSESNQTSGLKVIQLSKLDSRNILESFNDTKFQVDKESKKEEEPSKILSYPLIAKLRGHKNDFAPSICYIPHSNCLVSAEKHYFMNQENSKTNVDSKQKSSKENENTNQKCQILIWNIQRDMIELFSTQYPWNIPYHKKWFAHDSSIIDICYLQKSQLLVTTGMDQTIRFWDPVQTSYELTDPSSNPHAQQKPGYYKPLQPEQTKSNETFKEVKRIYCGNDTNCYALRSLCISGVVTNSSQPQNQSQIEWLICLKNPKQVGTNQEQQRSNRVGIICGYGVERIKIEVPAKHVDDIIPPSLMQECEELCTQQRLKITTAIKKSIPGTIETIYSQTQLQNSLMVKIQDLFMRAILDRQDGGKFVNPVPLREIYKVLLKLPQRSKFQSFLASTGCNDQLSVSETFFYLQKFMQIHPLRTTQIEFQKSIEDFYHNHQRKFLKGIKRWSKAAIQNFANYIRQYGIDISYLQQPNESQTQITTANFCTRERLQNYFLMIHKNHPHITFKDDEIEIILNELDPYQTGAIQINLIQKQFREELEYNKQITLKKPQEIIEKIRQIAIPNKKIQLQQSLAAADESGDGYITKLQYINAMYRAEINIDRDQLELLFDIMAEHFDMPKIHEQNHDNTNETKYLNLPFFFSKIFTKSEVQQVSEVDQTLQHIKAAFIYKGIDFGVVFAESQTDETSNTKGRSKQTARKVINEGQIDLMCHYKRFAQQIVKQEFCDRVAQLNAVSITPDKIMRLANYLSLNQKNQSVIYLNTWLHHLRRINTQFQVADRAVLPIICSKLLKNESIFRSYIESIGMLKQKREEEKFCEQADLRQVLKKFGISYINQGLFLQEFTKGTAVHMQDLIARMKACVKSHYNIEISDQSASNKENSIRLITLTDLRKTDYFERVQKRINNAKETSNKINIGELVHKIQEFDEGDTGVIHAYKLVNILKHQLPDLFDEETLIGLQYELESLSSDHTVDYSEFIKIFFQGANQSKKLNIVTEIKLENKKSAYNLNEYEDLLGRIKIHVESQGLDLPHIFEIFCKKTAFISYQDLKKIIDLIEFPISDQHFDLLIMYADESGLQNIHAHELAQQIINAELVAPQFDILKWKLVSDKLEGRFNILEEVFRALPQIKDFINQEYGEGKPHQEVQVITGQQFQTVIRKTLPQMSYSDVDRLTTYCIMGSRRAPQNGEKSNPPIVPVTDLIQINHFERAINEVVSDMRKDDDNQQQKNQKAKRKQLVESEFADKKEKNTIRTIPINADALKRESQLINKVTQIFRERDVSFYDAFQQYFDPLASKNIITMKLFKELINKLNLPLTVQDQRIIRRIADPSAIGKVDLKNFCNRFETYDLRMIRLNQTLDKIATAFYIQNFNLRKAFQLFDVNGDGRISKQELRQGFSTLEIGIKYDEINDLMKLMSNSSSNEISYDEFAQRMDADIRHRKDSVGQQVEDQVFKNISECIENSGESLFKLMKVYDSNNQGQIQAQDLPRVFKRLGIQQIEPHMPLILKTGGVREQDECVEITDFCKKFMKEIQERAKSINQNKILTINKLHSVLRIKNLSFFDFFVQLDTNKSGRISLLELKTGIQSLNLFFDKNEFQMLWSLLYKQKNQQNQKTKQTTRQNDNLKGQEPEICYLDLVNGFIQSGAIKFNKSTDRADIIIAKFRQQMKRLGFTVDKLYKWYDENDLHYVFKNDFIDISYYLGFEFSEDEFTKIFETFCRQGEKENSKKTVQTRFNFKQMHDSLLVQKDINWIYLAYIKIHSVVLQKGLTYKRLFTQWKTGKAAAGKLTALEISAGLKKLKAGLTQDEIDKLTAQLNYDIKDHTITEKDFENTVVQGAQKLEKEQSYNRMVLAGWIKQFNDQMARNFATIDNLFNEFDGQKEGQMGFNDFAAMNEQAGVSMNRKDLLKIFELIDRNKNSKVRLEDLKNLSQFMMLQEQANDVDISQDWQIKEDGLKGDEIILRQKVNDVYEELKNKIETKNLSLEHAIFQDSTSSKDGNKTDKKETKADKGQNQVKLDPNSLATISGIKQALEKFQISINDKEADRIIRDVRSLNYGKFEATYRNFVEFMTKKKINIALADKGFIDPLIANTVFQINRVKDQYEFTYEELFRLLDAERKDYIGKEQFMICMQGINLGCAVEDIIELFNYMDDTNQNRVTKDQFVNNLINVSSKMGGPSIFEQQMSKGLLQSKKGVTNIQLVLSIFRKICEIIETRKLSIKQLNLAMDINKTGYLSKQEFTQMIQQFSEDKVKIDEIRVIVQFLDGKDTGKISIFEFLKILMEILNQQIGGGMYAFMQVLPIIQKIVNELSIDCDRFFDEVADLNQAWLDQQAKTLAEFSGVHFQFKQIGLLKSIFLKTLHKYGVSLTEKDNALITSVFGLKKQDRDKLDYVKLDAAFEGVQQQLYAQESQYTIEWERRVFKKIGDYLMRLNISIHNCFQMIDTDDSCTISMQELQNAIIRFELGLTNKQTKAFLARLDSNNQGFITQQEFIQRFWSAYTYDDVFGDDQLQDQDPNSLSKVQLPSISLLTSQNINAANQQMKSLLDEKVQSYRMLKSVQKRIIQTMNVQQAFISLDTNSFGFLTLRDFQINLSKYFNLSLKAKEVRALFQEIDSDENGIVKFGELDDFYNNDYKIKVQRVQQERQDRCMQNEIFDHLIKVLKQRGLTLQQVFDEIDDDKNNYIEASEFQDMLERMGFTITQDQVVQLMQQMDENFDGRISYNEMKAHLHKLGFNIQELEGKSKDVEQTLNVYNKHNHHQKKIVQTEQKWRDKAIELMIRTIQAKVTNKSIKEYLLQYDLDHDGCLTPNEFRKSILDLKEPQIKSTQIDRILHILLEERKLKAVTQIERICNLFNKYSYVQENSNSNSTVLIDEDLFVYIVEKYDGLTRMIEFMNNLQDKSQYFKHHQKDLSSRGLNLISNQHQIIQLGQKSQNLIQLYQSTLILLAGGVSELMKLEATKVVLDPLKNIATIVSDKNVGQLNSVNLPSIENSQFDIDFMSIQQLPCGAQKYSGVLLKTKEPIEILLYPSENLNYVSLDGKTYKRHLAFELLFHRYLMGPPFSEEDDDQNKKQTRLKLEQKIHNEKSSEIFFNIGKFEKKIGLSVNEKEIYVVNQHINEDEWINMDDFVNKNGGILNIPLFYHTDAPLYIIRYWAKLLLQIIAKVHDVQIVLRSLSTKQLWISRDGQRIRLGHVRGCGRLDNLGFLKSCPDIYLNLDNNERNSRDGKQSTGFSPSKGGGLQSSRRTNDGSQRTFSNRALDTPFIAPEVIFQKYTQHTSAIDVWAFGMIMFCLIFGKKPVSYYQIYRQWLLKAHQTDAEMGNIPFIPPAKSNFIYDPFMIDFENPFDQINIEDLAAINFKYKISIEEAEAQFKAKDGSLNFENFMKCISDLSYSGMFTKENSKKFNYAKIVPKETKKDQNEEDENQDKNLASDKQKAKTVQDNLLKNKQKQVRLKSKDSEITSEDQNNDQLSTLKQSKETQKQASIRKQFLLALGKNQILERKNELGLILDLISACLDINPKKRPTIQGLLNSPIFLLDIQEKTNAVRFSQNVILYKNPQNSVSVAITHPLRQICSETIKSPLGVFDHLETIIKIFCRVEDVIQYNTSLPIDELNEVLNENEKRKGLNVVKTITGYDASRLRVCPNSPLAAQVIEDKVIDMLLFLTLRSIKQFQNWKKKQIQDLDMRIQIVKRDETQDIQNQISAPTGSVTHGTSKTNKSKDSNQLTNQHEELKKNMLMLKNQILERMAHLLKQIVYQMNSYNTPMSPHVAEVISYIVKFFIGEESAFGSDIVLSKTLTQHQLKEFLRERSFFRRDSELDSSFKPDQTDKLWYQEQKNKIFFEKSDYWCLELHNEALKIYKEAISESGRGQSCYPVICDFINSLTNSFEPTKIFSKQMNHLSMSFLIPMNKTSAYYNELIPIAESLSRLYSQDLDLAGKKLSLAMIRSVFQTGNSDKIKACLDMRVPKHLINFIQDQDQDVRKEVLNTYLEISKGLYEDDFEVIEKQTSKLKREFNKQGYNKTSFDLNKAANIANQSNENESQAKTEKNSSTNRRGGQVRQQAQELSFGQTEAQCNYIKRTTTLVEKNENEKYINFALELPNLNFLASKCYLKELAVCFESPTYISPLVRLMKTPTELHTNKLIILEIFKNLMSGNEKVLAALNSPAYDTYMTLLKNLMVTTKIQFARQYPQSEKVTAETRRQIVIQDKTLELFIYMFDQRRPSIIRDLSCIGASSTLLHEQELTIPSFIGLPEIMSYFDDFAEIPTITPNLIVVSHIIEHIKDLKCWIKYFFKKSTIAEHTRIKAIQRCINLLVRVLKVVWKEYFRTESDKENPIISTETKIDYMSLIRTCFSFFDWICTNDQFQFILNEQNGKNNLLFIINTCNMILCQFKKPLTSTFDSQTTALPITEDISGESKTLKDKNNCDIFPFTNISQILQNILYQIVRKNDPFINTLLSEANFGYVFGEQLILEYDFIRHCIDNGVDNLVLMESYIKKNEIRLNTFEAIILNKEDTIQDQLIKSDFCERVFLDYVRDFREFNIQFTKVDLQFLSFRRSYPIRLEAISLINTVLMQRKKSPQIYTEFLMYSRRHLLVRQELGILQTCMAVNSKEATAMLLFAILLESNDIDLVQMMVQEGVHRVIRTLLQEQPSLNKRFPIMKEFIRKF